MFKSFLPFLFTTSIDQKGSCCSEDFDCKVFFLRSITANTEGIVLLRKALSTYYNYKFLGFFPQRFSGFASDQN